LSSHWVASLAKDVGDLTVFIVQANSDIPRKGSPLSTRCGLQGDLQRLNVRLRVLLSGCRRPADEDSLKPFRGLVISDEEATGLLEDLDQWLHVTSGSSHTSRTI
jgi:hypothetical protein